MMNRKFYLLFLVIIICFLAGCARSFDSIDEFEKYIKGNDYPYMQTSTRNGIKVTLRYVPTDAMMIQYYKTFEKKHDNTKQDTTLSPDELEEKLTILKQELTEQKTAFSNSIYFHLTLGFENEKDDIVYNSMNTGFDNYSQWLQHLLFGLKEYIYIKTPNIKKVPLGLYHMERSYGLTKDRTLLLSFPIEFNEVKLLDEKKLTLIIKEFGMHSGRFTFEYNLPFKNIKFNTDFNKGDLV